LLRLLLLQFYFAKTITFANDAEHCGANLGRYDEHHVMVLMSGSLLGASCKYPKPASAVQVTFVHANPAPPPTSCGSGTAATCAFLRQKLGMTQ
jgi:hypothetical protein